MRSAGIRALPHCGTASDDCLYVSGTKHQQHTHGIYARTAMLCDGKPVSSAAPDTHAHPPVFPPPSAPLDPPAPHATRSPPTHPRTAPAPHPRRTRAGLQQLS